MFSHEGTTALIIGIANDLSIAWGCAKALEDRSAKLDIYDIQAGSPISNKQSPPILSFQPIT
ncbi:hypothetical protein [Nisaea sp.]|uniref:hypothetical protein n=1 Tax=Nisaea sp. TaxID=2024842 RepID=UPI00329A0EE6